MPRLSPMRPAGNLSAALFIVLSMLAGNAPAAATGFAFPQPIPIGGHPVPRASPSGAPSSDLGRFLTRIGARYLGPAHLSRMTVDVATPLRNGAALRTYATAADTPGSVYYRHFLSPAQIADAFGTPAADYARDAGYFAARGLIVKTWPARTMLTLTGTQSGIERTLGLRFGMYRSRAGGVSQTFFAPSAISAAGVPAAIGSVDSGRLVSFEAKRSFALAASAPHAVGSGFSDGFVTGVFPAESARAVDDAGAYESGYTGKGVTIGIIGTGPINPADVPFYRRLFGVPGSSTVTQVPVTVVSSDSTPPYATGPCTGGTSKSPSATCDPEDGEAQIDTEQTASLAYDASVLFYLAYDGDDCIVEGAPLGAGCAAGATTSQGIDLSNDELMQAESDDRADVLSLSFGTCESLAQSLGDFTADPGGQPSGTEPTIFMMLAAQGIATFASTGDSGSAGCQPFLEGPMVTYPSTDPNVVAVGGANVPTAVSGTLVGPITQWGPATRSGASTAGISAYFPTPPSQAAEANVAAICPMRCVPDVEQEGDPNTGVAVIENAGANQGGALDIPYGGTSVAAPQMAAMWALVLSACAATPSCTAAGASSRHPFRLGDPNALWYALANSPSAAPYHATFDDIVTGSDGIPTAAQQTAAANGGPSAYAAGVEPGSTSASPGFDEVSGLGVPFGRALIRFVVGV